MRLHVSITTCVHYTAIIMFSIQPGRCGPKTTNMSYQLYYYLTRTHILRQFYVFALAKHRYRIPLLGTGIPIIIVYERNILPILKVTYLNVEIITWSFTYTLEYPRFISR